MAHDIYPGGPIYDCIVDMETRLRAAAPEDITVEIGFPRDDVLDTVWVMPDYEDYSRSEASESFDNVTRVWWRWLASTLGNRAGSLQSIEVAAWMRNVWKDNAGSGWSDTVEIVRDLRIQYMLDEGDGGYLYGVFASFDVSFTETT